MADWDGLRHDLERGLEPPPFQALRDRRHRRQQRRAIAATFAVVLVGTATGVALLGQDAQHKRQQQAQSAPSVVNRVALGDKLPARYVYKDFVVTDVDFVTPDTGWAIGLRCGESTCDVRTWRTDDGGRSWRDGVPVATGVPRETYSTQDPSGGGVRSLRMVDANEGFAFNPDLYVTHDGARTWTRLPQPSKVASLSVSGGSVWAFERGCAADDDCDAVLTTTTIGPTFGLRTARIPATAGAPTIMRRADAANAYLLSFDRPDAPLHRTADAGKTWQRATNPCADAGSALLSAGRDRPLLAVCGKAAYRSADAGTTWQRAGELPQPGTLTDLVSVSATTAYATMQEPARLLVTRDGGATWRPAQGAATKAYGYANLDAVDATHVWAMGDAGVLWRTSDGVSWERSALPPDGSRASGTPRALLAADPGVRFSDVSFLDARRGWALGARCKEGTCHPALRRTGDGGRTWTTVGAPRAGRVSRVAFADDRNGWLYGTALYATHDGGTTWRRVAPVGAVYDVVPRGGVVWVVGYEGCAGMPCGATVYRADVTSDEFASAGARDFAHASFAAVDATHAYLLQDGIRDDDPPLVAATADGGATWTTHPAPCRTAKARTLAAWDVDRLWVLCGADDLVAVAQSDDAGAHWHTVTAAGASGLGGALRAMSATDAWHAEEDGGLLATQDGGRTWTPVSWPDDVRAVSFVSGTQGWALDDKGVVHRTTDGETWVTLGRP